MGDLTTALALGQAANHTVPTLPDASLVSPPADEQIIINALLGTDDEGMPYPPPTQNVMPVQETTPTRPTPPADQRDPRSGRPATQPPPRHDRALPRPGGVEVTSHHRWAAHKVCDTAVRDWRHGTAHGEERTMRTEDLILISVDDHVIEPRGMFDGLLPAKYQDKAPQLIRRPDGTDYWFYDGNEIPNVGLNAVVGRPPEEYGIEPMSLDDMRVGCYDVHERVRDMSVNGVLGSMCFPSFPQFCGQLFARREDKDEALAMVRAYNDWHIDKWCGAEPGRFIPLSIPAIWDPELAAAEVRRVAKKGCHAVTFSENPEKLGWPSLHSDHWDPFWTACADEGTVVCMHLGSSSSILMTSIEAPIDVMISLQPINMVQAAADLIWSPILRKYKDLHFALSEGGIGWIPYALERIDYVYQHHHKWTGQDFGDQLPSQVFKDRIITCFIDDAFGVDNRRYLNIDNITWECDYPHSDSTWPTVTRGAHEVPRWRVGRGDRQDHPPQRHEALQLRPLQRPAPREVHRGRAAGRGVRRGHLARLPGPWADVHQRPGHRQRQQLRDASRPGQGLTLPAGALSRADHQTRPTRHREHGTHVD